MGKARKFLIGALLLSLVLGETIWWSLPSAAANPVRETKILVPYTLYEWWMIAWETNEILCQIFVDHEGLPTPEEAAESCGQEYAAIWVTTKPCNDPSGSSCNGVYVHLASTQPAQKEVTVELPPMEVWVNLEGCTPIPPENRCPTIPSLLITAKEPLPNERITSIQGLFDGVPFECQASECLLRLQPTPVQGLTVEFWSNSSFGDSSTHYTALVRVLDTGVSTVPGDSGWYVDVISTQWIGAPLASCARIWEAFPSIGTSTDWLAAATNSQLIASADPYFYLAGRLIAQRQVDASDCPSGGLLPNGYANSCGIEKARPLLVAWQNQFDQRIIEVSRGTGVPAQLLKNLFAQESQFWPGIFRVRYELGLGQITDHGADSIFLWNPEFYNQFCPMVLSLETCQPGYLRLDEEQRALLRGALAAEAGVDCASCPSGVDLSKTTDSVLLFAQALVANCSQVDQTIYTATRLKSGLVANYEDLWRFTIANYHAGPGCLSYAIHVTWQGIPPLTWEAVSANFTPACQGVIPYVNEIAP